MKPARLDDPPWIRSAILRVAPVRAMALAERHSDYAGMNVFRDERGHRDDSVVGAKFEHLVAPDSQSAGGIGMNLGPVVPHDLSDRFGNFLKPRLVRADPIVEKDMRIGDQDEFGILIGRCRSPEARRVEPDRGRFWRGEESAFTARLGPEIFR